MSHSAGSAMAEMDIVTESLTYKLNALKETGVGIAQNLFPKEGLGETIDGLTKVLEVVDKLTEEIGLLGTIGLAGGIASLFNMKRISSLISALRATTLITDISKSFEMMSYGGLSFGTFLKTLSPATAQLATFIGVAAGLGATVALVDSLTTSFGEMTKKADESRKSLQETETNLESLQKELSTNKARIKELKAQDELSLDNKQELNTLQRQNRLLENQIALQEKLADIQREKAAQDARDVFNKKDSFTQQTSLESYTNKKNQLDSLNAQELSISNRLKGYTKEEMEYSESDPFKMDRNMAQRHQAYEEDVAALEKIHSEQESLVSDISEYDTTFAENYASLFDSEGKLVNPEDIDTVRQYNEAVLYSGTAFEVAKQKRSELNKIIDEFIAKEDQASFSQEEFTRQFGTEKLQDLKLALAEAGFSLSDLEYKLSKTGNEIANGDLRSGAEEAVNSLKQLSKFKDEVGLDSALTTTATGDDKKDVLERNIRKMESIKVRPDVDTSDIENANKVIAYCRSELQELEKPAILNVDTSKLNKGQKDLVTLLKKFNEVSNEKEIQVEVGADTSESNKKLKELKTQIQEKAQSLKIDTKVDTSSVKSIKSALKNGDFENALDIPVEVDDEEASGYKPPDDKTMPVTVKVDGTNANNYKPPSKTMDIYTNVIGGGSSKKSSDPKGEGRGGFNGTAHLRGTAFGGGSWGANHGGRALVGELGISMPFYMATYIKIYLIAGKSLESYKPQRNDETSVIVTVQKLYELDNQQPSSEQEKAQRLSHYGSRIVSD